MSKDYIEVSTKDLTDYILSTVPFFTKGDITIAIPVSQSVLKALRESLGEVAKDITDQTPVRLGFNESYDFGVVEEVTDEMFITELYNVEFEDDDMDPDMGRVYLTYYYDNELLGDDMDTILHSLSFCTCGFLGDVLCEHPRSERLRDEIAKDMFEATTVISQKSS